jgi:ribosomal protein S18 acetylase RimI-like enzyme
LGGPTGLALHTFDWAMNRWSSWSIHRCLNLNEARVQLQPKLQFRKLTAEEAGVLLAPLNDGIDAAFVEHASRKQDSCYAVFDGETVAHFTWFSTQSTLVDLDWRLEIPDGIVYKYNAFTFPEFRGRRLDSFVSTRALTDFRRRGYHSLICLVSRTNFPALRSNTRLGSQPLGTIASWKRGRMSCAYVTRSLRDNGIRLSAVVEPPLGLD